MSAHLPRPRPRDVLLMVPVGVLVLGTLPVVGRGGPWRGAGEDGDRGPFAPGGHGPGLPGLGTLDPGAVVLAVLAVLAIGLRRWPQLAALLATSAIGTSLALGHPYGPVLLPAAITAWSLARRLPLPRSAVAAGGAVALLLTGDLVRVLLEGESPLGALLGALPISAWVVVPWCLGLVRRLVQEARRRHRAEQERQALDAERTRLAAEVHDVVGHGLAAIRMQADIALHVADRRPEQAQEALRVISRASAEALAELRATLAAVAPETAGDESRAATPGLHRVEDLCARMREAGIEVELEVVGEPEELPAAADVAAYRILQESLTNVVKHAARRRAAVRIAHGGDAVEIRVRSASAPGQEVRDGFGISGMRRRAADVGGHCEVTVQDGVVEVRARLPRDHPRYAR